MNRPSNLAASGGSARTIIKSLLDVGNVGFECIADIIWIVKARWILAVVSRSGCGEVRPFLKRRKKSEVAAGLLLDFELWRYHRPTKVAQILTFLPSISSTTMIKLYNQDHALISAQPITFLYIGIILQSSISWYSWAVPAREPKYFVRRQRAYPYGECSFLLPCTN